MKDSFVVQYSILLWLQAVGVSATGPIGLILIFFLSRVLGSMLDFGILQADIALDKLGQALRSDQWRKAALQAYQRASSKVYTEDEKNAIRKEYLDALTKYVSFTGVPDGQ